MLKINHESDFKLPVEPKEIPNLSASPFELVFYTRKSVNKYVASYDGTKYTNCYPTSDGGLVVVFDNHNLGCGTMWCDVHMPLPDKDFKDGIFNYRSTEPTGVLLHKGATDDVRGLKMDVFPFFLQGADGKSAYDLWLDQGNEGTVEEFLASLSFPNDSVLDEELYYDNGSGEVVPVKHPDLSTQPNILPYKFAGNYVYEQMVWVEGSKLIDSDEVDLIKFKDYNLPLASSIILDYNIFILGSPNIGNYSAIYNYSACPYNLCSNNERIFFKRATGSSFDGEGLWIRIVWTILNKPNDYYYEQ